ncbi:hypothetical protein, conserved [Trypanosoma brucei gambiense DAL972]|uniref:Uncharacterized protein n=1 Tax=Trypanosoma brucei gambiense (strain MHOM/CI/86/DAL972) TaxID=679716 RepID=C9ZL20_TRYB9|nr:hypothetical protein, conserved [Trypanosoma brucei gambiense DAL972]CBH10029.1 hypothetical protein, conserved [Trypanosoma brucei gambiense DAL972]|eukprot:XP_011772319.1 hypothetical protein, conserved [Trypanosoma brucei gambiense DAL972]
MFCVSAARLTALASHQPILPPSVSTRVAVMRFLGDGRSRVPNINTINTLITKTGAKGLAGNASVLGKAMFYLKRGNPVGAIAEIDKILPEISDDALKRFAVGIRLRARNDLLDMKESALKVHGGITELEVSDIRAALRDDYKVLEAASPGCWLFELAVAEYRLYEGCAKDAYDSFRLVEKSIQEYILSLKKPSPSQALHGTDNHASLVLAFQLSRAPPPNVPKVSSKILDEAIKGIVEGYSTKEATLAFKKDLGAALTDEEVVELVYIFEAAHIRHHFHDYFPLHEDYRGWGSERANAAKGTLASHSTSSVFLDDKLLASIRTSVPHQPFYAGEDELRRFMSSDHKDLIAELRHTFGSGPKTSLAKSEDAYFDALKAVENSPMSADAAGSAAYPVSQNDICLCLAHQLLYRTRVNIAVALTQLDRLEEAVPILDGVINADEYIYMWRALLARGEANKRFGHIGKSDEDFRQLLQLKRITSADA